MIIFFDWWPVMYSDSLQSHILGRLFDECNQIRIIWFSSFILGILQLSVSTCPKKEKENRGFLDLKKLNYSFLSPLIIDKHIYIYEKLLEESKLARRKPIWLVNKNNLYIIHHFAKFHTLSTRTKQNIFENWVSLGILCRICPYNTINTTCGGYT